MNENEEDRVYGKPNVKKIYTLCLLSIHPVLMLFFIVNILRTSCGKFRTPGSTPDRLPIKGSFVPVQYVYQTGNKALFIR